MRESYQSAPNTLPAAGAKCYDFFMASKIPTKKDFSAGGLVWDEKKKRLLIVQVENLRGEVVWTFPKGHPNKGETDRAAALREVREETGWDCRIVRKLTDVRYFYVHNGVRFLKTVRWYVMTPVKKTGTPMEGEIRACRWASPDGARKRVVYKSDFALLDKLFGKARNRLSVE